MRGGVTVELREGKGTEFQYPLYSCYCILTQIHLTPSTQHLHPTKHFPIELFEPLISQGLDAGQPLSIPYKIPLLFHLFPTEILISIKPPEIYRQAYVYS